MGTPEPNTALLAPNEGPVAEVINPAGPARIVLVCEHASAFIPASFSGLGLLPEESLSHAAWDIGALAVAKRLSAMLDAPLVASRVSRLVYDCNRSPSAKDAIPLKSELITTPGNANLSEDARAARVREIYEPFRQLLGDTLSTFPEGLPAIITIHSFTPVFFGQPRSVELGLLHDEDDRLAREMLAAAEGRTSMKAELNAPYGRSDGVMHTLKEHALPRHALNVMIELRNDLIRDGAGVERVASDLADMIESALAACDHPVASSTGERRQG
jgi:predicted N-formylglutamate amidohydrolase